MAAAGFRCVRRLFQVRQWQFLSLEMPQWLVGIFAAYLLVAILVIVAQPFKAKKRDLFGR